MAFSHTPFPRALSAMSRGWGSAEGGLEHLRLTDGSWRAGARLDFHVVAGGSLPRAGGHLLAWEREGGPRRVGSPCGSRGVCGGVCDVSHSISLT